MTNPTRWTPPEWPDAPEVECERCEGRGYTVVPARRIQGVFFSPDSERCPYCHGTGTVPAPVEERDEDTAGDEKYHQAVDDDAERGGGNRGGTDAQL